MTEQKQRRKPRKYTDENKQQLVGLYRAGKRRCEICVCRKYEIDTTSVLNVAEGRNTYGTAENRRIYSTAESGTVYDTKADRSAYSVAELKTFCQADSHIHGR